MVVLMLVEVVAEFKNMRQYLGQPDISQVGHQEQKKECVVIPDEFIKLGLTGFGIVVG